MFLSNELETFHSAARRSSMTKKFAELMRERQRAELRARTVRGRLAKLIGGNASDIRVGRQTCIFTILATPDTVSVRTFIRDDDGRPDPKWTWDVYFEFDGEAISHFILRDEMEQGCMR